MVSMVMGSKYISALHLHCFSLLSNKEYPHLSSPEKINLIQPPSHKDIHIQHLLPQQTNTTYHNGRRSIRKHIFGQLGLLPPTLPGPQPTIHLEEGRGLDAFGQRQLSELRSITPGVLSTTIRGYDPEAIEEAGFARRIDGELVNTERAAGAHLCPCA